MMPRLMNRNDPVQIVANGTCPVPLGLMVPFTAIKNALTRSTVHLLIWANLEQRAEE
jgi:hypothetical protein